MDNVFSISKPKTALPLVYDSPHSGAHYPEDFDYTCDFDDLVYTEDKYVDELFASAPNHGGSFLIANFPRSYIDPNRAIDDVDLKILADEWSCGDINPTARSDAGIGLIRRLVKPGMPLYKEPLKSEEVIHRIEKYYKPYHSALEQLIEEAHYNFGQAWHINCHSMPASSATPKQPIGLIGNAAKASDFVLGDRDGKTCDINFTHALRDFLKGLGYTVTLNDPFKGVELVERYSNPARGRHSIQIEINKALYMNEVTHEKSSNFSALKADTDRLIQFCSDYVSSQLVDLAAD